MKLRESLLCQMAMGFAIAALPAMAQSSDVPPDQPFQTVHLINIPTPEAEKIMLTAVKDLNAAIAKAGCPKCIYHLWKIAGTQSGSFNYLWNSYWPGREVYVKVHNSDPYQTATKKNEAIEKFMETQVYNRYVEVTSGK